jgi:hypothetical protein
MTELSNNELLLEIMKKDNLIIVLNLEDCSLSKYFYENIKSINMENIGILSKKINNNLFNNMMLYTTPKFILTIKNIGYELYPYDIEHLNKLISKYIT